MLTGPLCHPNNDSYHTGVSHWCFLFYSCSLFSCSLFFPLSVSFFYHCLVFLIPFCLFPLFSFRAHKPPLFSHLPLLVCLPPLWRILWGICTATVYRSEKRFGLDYQHHDTTAFPHTDIDTHSLQLGPCCHFTQCQSRL